MQTRSIKRIRLDVERDAKAFGVDLKDRRALAAFAHMKGNMMLAGILDRFECGCGGRRHGEITGTEGV